MMGRKCMHFLLSLFCVFFSMAHSNTIPVNVGVVLDMETWVGKMGLSCISMALSDFYASHGHYKTRLVLHTRDSKSDVVGAAAAALDLLKNVEVEAIIGPVSSMQANFLISLGENAHVPIISFSATSPSLTSIRSEYFFRATLNDSSQVKAISSIIKAFGWKEVVPIYVDNEYGEGIIPSLIDALNENEARVPYRSVIPPFATDEEIAQELQKLMNKRSRVFIVHTLRSLGARIFKQANALGMISEGYVWITSDGITNLMSMMDHAVLETMEGVIGVKTHVPRRKRREEFANRWKNLTNKDNIGVDLNIFGLWAYDAATALIMAIEKVHIGNSSFKRINISRNSTDLDTIGVSPIGVDLCEALSAIRFKGLAGDFHIVNGQLQSSAFQIVNIIGSGEKGVGFWTPDYGLVKKLNVTGSPKYSTSKANLRTVIWPGDITSTPKGWAIPIEGKKLRVGVPVKHGFTEFVQMSEDITGVRRPTGYCIAVFEAVMASLPYAVPYEYIPFSTPDGKSAAGSYNDLVDQVKFENYDAVVGDVTILANRSLYVDFTLPFTDSGVKMVVPFKDRKKKNAWVFLKPLTWDLWVTSACFFVFFGFVMWILEHGNADSGRYQGEGLATSLWFSFSTMVFSHKEEVVSHLARFVVIIWCFVVLILTQSYTASLTSMLTVQQLEPTYTDLKTLAAKGESIGYQSGSFVLQILREHNFNKSQLKTYNTIEELHTALSNGTAKGGVAAAFDEIPYMKLFVSQYCSKYTMVEPTHKTDGFGFVFPKGSPLVADVSRAILNVTEGPKMLDFEKMWFGETKDCPEATTMKSNSLSLGNFAGLFLVVIVASSFALIIFTAMLLYEKRRSFMRFGPRDLWNRIVVKARNFKSSVRDWLKLNKDKPSQEQNQQTTQLGSISNPILDGQTVQGEGQPRDPTNPDNQVGSNSHEISQVNN